jgi:hypothetical protein
MDNKTLRILLDKYYRGEAALGEEEMLRKHLSDREVMEPDFESDRLLIQLTQMRKKEGGKDAPDLEENLSRFLDRRLSTRSVFSSGRSVFRYAAAAAVVLAIGISALLVFRQSGQGPVDTFSDPQLAYREAENTLVFVSKKINEGMAPLSNVDKIREGTEHLKALNEIEENLGMVGFISFVNLNSSLQQ